MDNNKMDHNTSRTILVTGASGGIGREICVALAEEARLYRSPVALAVHGSRDTAALETLAAVLAGEYVKVKPFKADLTDATAPDTLVRDIVQWSGRLDVVVSNAGQSRPGKLAELSVDDWQQCMDLNMRATWLLAKAAYPELRRVQGNIVAVASMSGLNPHPGYGAYSAAKAGLVMLCQQLAVEWSPERIRVNTVCPGMIRTPLTESVYQNADVKARREALVPLGRIGTPRDIANAVVFLSSDKASYVTGTSMVVDGGVSGKILDLIPGRPDKQTS